MLSSYPVFIFVLTTGLAYLGVSLYRRWATKNQMVYEPNELTAHTKTMPHGGGVVIVAVTLIGATALALFGYQLPLISLIAYLNGAIIIAIVSWFDDKNYLPIAIRFSAHSVAAMTIIVALVITTTQAGSSFWLGQWGWLAGVGAFFWLAGFANLFNFMDGVDGMAGLQAVVAGLAWAILGWHAELPAIAAIGLFMAASSLGFLGHNWSPATIFMGDVSSVFLGYTLAALPLLAAQKDLALLPLGIIITWPCFFDPALTIIRRLLRGENVFIRHRSFLFHRMAIVGYSHSTISLLYGGLTLIASTLAVTWYIGLFMWGLAVAIGVMAFALWRIVDSLEERQPAPSKTQETKMIELVKAVGNQ